ncbi:MAG TPA: energy transducer TonB [Gemmatimonadales bacterium]|nr:energy transducer TonB [Gemmatimonadales bacterium]
MTTHRPARATAVVLGLLACGKAPPSVEVARAPTPDQEPPVPLNADSPIQYPPRLFDARVEGDVVLRLYTDSSGRLLPESSRVAESSGVRALDSAALAGSSRLRFAPARRRGVPVATSFLEPVEFRHTQTAALLGDSQAHASSH